jgi:hypothetical protein
LVSPTLFSPFTDLFCFAQPEWSYLQHDPRLCTQAMSYLISVFWVKIHETQAPAVHRASFRFVFLSPSCLFSISSADSSCPISPTTAPTPLLLSMVRFSPLPFPSNSAHSPFPTVDAARILLRSSRLFPTRRSAAPLVPWEGLLCASLPSFLRSPSR